MDLALLLTAMHIVTCVVINFAPSVMLSMSSGPGVLGFDISEYGRLEFISCGIRRQVSYRFRATDFVVSGRLAQRQALPEYLCH